ncbi:hypothetical protein GGI43DRAFT_409064 [Trichoderma evansii]
MICLNRSASLVLVPVLHTCASAAAPSPLERAYRRYGVHVLHIWASGNRRMDARARAIHTKEKKLGAGRRALEQSKSFTAGGPCTSRGTGTGTCPRWREGAISISVTP